jgi:hypothetical protein
MLECVVSRTVSQTVSQVVAAGAVAVLTLGCSDMDPGSDTFRLTNVDPKWACLDDPPVPPTQFPAMVRYTFPLVDWADATLPLVGRQVTVCSRADTLCSQPLDMIDLPAEPREVTIVLPAGENIYLRLTQPERVPELLYFAGPLYRDQTGGRVPLLTPLILGTLAANQGVMLDLMRGAIALRSHDCTGGITGGALFEIENGGAGIAYTAVNDLPTVTDLMPKAVTDIPTQLGNVPFAGFVNVMPGNFVVNGMVNGMVDDPTVFGGASFFAPPAAISIVEVRPVNFLN